MFNKTTCIFSQHYNEYTTGYLEDTHEPEENDELTSCNKKGKLAEHKGTSKRHWRWVLLDDKQ